MGSTWNPWWRETLWIRVLGGTIFFSIFLNDWLFWKIFTSACCDTSRHNSEHRPCLEGQNSPNKSISAHSIQIEMFVITYKKCLFQVTKVNSFIHTLKLKNIFFPSFPHDFSFCSMHKHVVSITDCAGVMIQALCSAPPNFNHFTDRNFIEIRILQMII